MPVVSRLNSGAVLLVRSRWSQQLLPAHMAAMAHGRRHLFSIIPSDRNSSIECEMAFLRQPEQNERPAPGLPSVPAQRNTSILALAGGRILQQVLENNWCSAEMFRDIVPV